MFPHFLRLLACQQNLIKAEDQTLTLDVHLIPTMADTDNQVHERKKSLAF